MSLYSYPLLVEKYHNQILKFIESNKVSIIKGPTGCGKSTYIPYILRDKKVAIIEPRRIAVTALYNTLSSKISNVGYKMRFNSNITSSTTMKIFTDGSFLNTIEYLDYDYIIIDEVHERSVRTDLILMCLKGNLKSKLILMSATLDTTKLEKYFKAKTFNIPGSGHPLEIKYLDEPTNDYITETYFTIKKILKSKERNEKKDILVFLPGEEDIKDCWKLCQKLPGITVMKIHSTMNDIDQQKIYEESDQVRVILSTNVCETSLTIPNVKYVVDCGLVKNKIYDGISYLGIQPITQESATQRMGRCNRLGPGVCYKLYQSSERLLNTIPEIEVSDITSAFLFLINMKKNILKLEFIDYPTLNNVKAAISFLLSKKCISVFLKHQKYESIVDLLSSNTSSLDSSFLDDVTFKITNYGRRLIFHPFDVHLAHFYEQSVTNNVGYYGGMVVSLISQENNNFLDAQQSKVSDIEYLITLFESYLNSEDKIEFCKKKNIPLKGMESAYKIFSTLNKKKDGDLLKLEQVFSKSFEHNLAIRLDDGSYKLESNNSIIYIHPSSGFFKRHDKKIVVVDIFSGSKLFGRIVGKYYP